MKTLITNSDLPQTRPRPKKHSEALTDFAKIYIIIIANVLIVIYSRFMSD